MRALALFALLISVLAACPPAKPDCNASSCPTGCCSMDGECLPGNDKQACGTGGLFCRACEAADTCAGQRCDLVRPDAGACPTAFHRCDDRCVSNDDVATCGDRCDSCPRSPNGTATCAQDQCGLSCKAGFHVCGSTCADDTSPMSCGDRCGPCSFPPNSMPSCTNRQCDFSCANGFHRCGDECVPDTDPASCGGRCSPCGAPTNGSATCVGRTSDAGTTLSCDFVCGAGFHRCGMACLSDDAPESCGTSCTPCPSTANGTATCAQGACGIQCAGGFNFCGGGCVPDTSATACGPSCSVCSAPDGGAPVCQSNACAFTCAAGFNPCNGQCASATDVTSCGASCTTCPDGVPGSIPTCDGTSCGTTCAAGNTTCGSAPVSCVGPSVASACGAGCTTCATGNASQRATCVSGACGLACIDSCGAVCVDEQRDSTNCGACGTACGSTEACVEGRCRPACANGVVFTGIAEQLPHAFVAGTAPRFWAVDVTGDGRLDLVATAGTSRFAFINEGNARFTGQPPADAGTTLLPLASADFSLDGRDDLIAGDLRALWVVAQTSAGFASPLVLFTNGQNGLTVPADFTGDGRPDLLRVPMLGNFNADLWVNASADGGAPFSQTRNAAPNLLQAELARAADFTNDGRADLVTAQAGQLRVFVTSGATAFTQAATAPSISGLVAMATGELTGDGNEDLAVVTASAVSVLPGNGDGGIAAATFTTNGGATLAAIEIADLDGDALDDLALGTGRGLEILWATGPGTFTPPDVYEVDGFTNASPANQLQLVDVTGDGRLDAVVGNALVKASLVRNGATGRGFERTVKTAVAGGGEFVLAARLDGDARTDLIVSRRATVSSMLPIATQTRVLRANADGTFAVGPDDLLTRPEAVGDFDADGQPDLLRLDCPNPPLPDGGVNPTPMPCVARLEFGASFRFGAASVSLPLNELATEVLLRAGDLDGDGAPDVVARTKRGFLVFHNDGARQFGAPVVTPFLPAVVELQLTDVDRDGRLDLVVLANANAPRAVFILFSRPTGLVLAPRVSAFDFDTGLASGFVDADAFPDVAGSTGVLVLGNGAATFSRGADWRPATVQTNASFLVDTDGDGRGEVVSRSFATTTLANPAVPVRGFSARVERFADVTGDGVPDWVGVSSTALIVGVGRCR